MDFKLRAPVAFAAGAFYLGYSSLGTFAMYFRAPHTYPGMGLELYISAQIIGRHGGTLGVKAPRATALSSILFYPFISRNKKGVNVERLTNE